MIHGNSGNMIFFLRSKVSDTYIYLNVHSIEFDLNKKDCYRNVTHEPITGIKSIKSRVGQQPQPLLLLCINLLKGAPDSLLFSKMIV